MKLQLQQYFKVIFRLAVCGVWMYAGNIMAQQDSCRVLEFTEPIEGRALKGHVFKNLSLKIQENCELNCYLENDCSSYNLGPLVDGRYVCELSDSDYGQHPRDLESRHGFIYGATKNSCSKSSCSAMGKCQIGFTDKGYRCVCQSGFEGQRCEQGTWLKINTNAVCFGARDEAYGSFTIARAGSISALKLVHTSGVLVCHETSTRSHWGCEVPLYGDKTLMTVLTYANRTVFLPNGHTAQMGVPTFVCASQYNYRLDGFDDISPEIIFNMSSKAMPVSMNQEFQIWYGQDIDNCSEENNDGQSCVDVYIWYNTLH